MALPMQGQRKPSRPSPRYRLVSLCERLNSEGPSHSNSRDANIAGGRDLEPIAGGQGGQTEGEELNEREHFDFGNVESSRLINILKE